MKLYRSRDYPMRWLSGVGIRTSMSRFNRPTFNLPVRSVLPWDRLPPFPPLPTGPQWNHPGGFGVKWFYEGVVARFAVASVRIPLYVAPASGNP
jgi:hypothetical protein